MSSTRRTSTEFAPVPPVAETDPELSAFLSQFVSDRRLRSFERVLDERTRRLTVVLEDIHHNFNASACLRTCDCFGIQDVHIVEDRNRYDVNADVALGASQWLCLHRHDRGDDRTFGCLRGLRDRGYRIVATSPCGGISPEALDVRRRTALVFGNEQEGVSGVAADMADEVLTIPMYGFTKSFNLSVSVALCLHRLVGALRRLPIEWKLTASERKAVRAEWIRRTLGHRYSLLCDEFHRRRTRPTRDDGRPDPSG